MYLILIDRIQNYRSTTLVEYFFLFLSGIHTLTDIILILIIIRPQKHNRGILKTFQIIQILLCVFLI